MTRDGGQGSKKKDTFFWRKGKKIREKELDWRYRIRLGGDEKENSSEELKTGKVDSGKNQSPPLPNTRIDVDVRIFSVRYPSSISLYLSNE